MMEKIWARQVPPEYQESPLFWDGELDAIPGIILTGNQDYNSHTTPEWDALMANHDDAFRALDDTSERNEYSWYSNFTEALQDLLPPTHKAKYSTREVHAWKAVLKDLWDDDTDDDAIIQGLRLMTGKEWESTCLRGCCQGDWQNCYYDSELWDREGLDRLESEYFNTGTEWIIHDEAAPPESPEDISGYSVYCTGWNLDAIREELAAAAGCKPEDLEMWESVEARSPSYSLQKVTA